MIAHILTVAALLFLVVVPPAQAGPTISYISPSNYSMSCTVGTSVGMWAVLTNPAEDNVWVEVTSSYMIPPLPWGPYQDLVKTKGVILAPGETKSISSDVASSGSAGSFAIHPLAPLGDTAWGAFTISVNIYDGDPDNGGALLSFGEVGSLPLLMTVVANPNRMTPTLSVGNSPLTYDGYPREAAVSGSVSGIVSNVKYDGSGMAPAIPGSYAVTADFTPYNTASFTTLSGASAGNFVIGKLPSTVTATGTTSFIYNASPQGPESATVTGSTGALTYSYTGTGSTSYSPVSTKPTGAGTYQVTATVAADEIYNSATSAPLPFAIAKAAATITLSNLAQAYDGTPKQPVATTNPVNKAVTFTYNGSSVSPSAIGSYAVVATIDDANYSGSTTGTMVIGQAQSISAINLSAPSCAIWETIMASAFATSGLTVSFSSLTPAICSVNGTSVSGLRAGTCTIAADQRGDMIYLPASRVTRSITVAVPMSLTVAIAGNGTGVVNSVPSSITCLKSSSGNGVITCIDFITGTLNLYATPSSISIFGGWGGNCSGTGLCSLTMNSDKTVTATFNQASLLRIGGQDYQTLQAAYNAATDNAIIQMLQDGVVGTLAADRGVTVKLKGGYDATYDPGVFYEPSGVTTVTAPIRIKAGKIIADRIVVK